MILNSKPDRSELQIIKLKELKPGDLFFFGKEVCVKFSDHTVKHLKNDEPNIMIITGSKTGHHCTANSESKVFVYKDSEKWYIES